MPTIPEDAILPAVFDGVEVDRTRYRTRGGLADPVTLSPALIDQAHALASRGNPRAFIGRSLGVNAATWYGWLADGKAEVEALDAWRRRGSEGEQPRVTMRAALFHEIEIGEGEAVDRILCNVLANGTARDQLRFLEIRHGKHFNANPSHVVDDETGKAQGADGGAVLDALLGKLKALASNFSSDESEGEP